MTENRTVPPHRAEPKNAPMACERTTPGDASGGAGIPGQRLSLATDVKSLSHQGQLLQP